MSEVNMEMARSIYESACSALDKLELNYRKIEEDLVILLGLRGDDMNHDMIFSVDEKREVIRLLEKMPFEIDPARSADVASAVCLVNDRLVLGGFTYNMEERLAFEVAQAYTGSLVGEETIKRLLFALVGTVEEYDDKFMALNKGYLKVDDFR